MKQYEQVTFPNYSYIFNFEANFVHQETRTWMQDNWTTGFYYSAVYIVVIFGGQHLMKNRPKFELRGILCLWNTLLAIFSIMGAFRTVPELLHVLTHHGLYYSVCSPSFIEHKAFGFWTLLFSFSKLLEFGDTVFIVLRKQPLIFLHWYHHITALLYTWFSYSEYSSTARWFIVMNYCVHSIMYSYYALRAWGYSPPKQVAMVITSLQLLQMVTGCGITIWVYQLLQQGVDCHVTPFNVKLSIAIYFSFFILFSRLFYKAYISTKNKKKSVHLTAEFPSIKSKLN